MFEIVTAFTNVVNTLIKAIPIGINKEEDRIYGQERREDLLDCTLMLFHKVNEVLHCSNFSPAQEESKEWDILRIPTNEVLENLFKATHSDKGYQIFTPEVYEKVKTEYKVAVFVRGQEPSETHIPLPLDEALNGIKFFYGPQSDLE